MGTVGLWVLLCLQVAHAAQAPFTPRCQPSSDEATVCVCVDWTAAVKCAPNRIEPDSEDECTKVGGVWGTTPHSLLAMSPMRSLLQPKCIGDWNEKKSRLEAKEVYDILISMRGGQVEQGEGEGEGGAVEALHPSLTPTRSIDLTMGSIAPPLHVSSSPALQHQSPFVVDESPRDLVVTPSFGPSSGGVWVQISGAGSFKAPNSLQCKLDLIEQFCYSNHYYYTWCYMSPKCAGVYDLTCHNGPLHYSSKYAVVAKTPWITSVYPYSGDTSGGTEVTVRGWNIEPHCPHLLLCRFGNQVVPAKFYTTSQVMCVAPCNRDKAFVSVEVSNDGGQHWSMSGVQFGYVGDTLSTEVLENPECQRYLSRDYVQPPVLSRDQKLDVMHSTQH